LLAFSGMGLRTHLPRLYVTLIVFFILVVAVLAIIFVEVIVFVFVVDVVVVVKNVIDREIVVGCHDAGSVAGFGLSRFGGGYVVQKWRPQRLHTQN
jgi:hypothetical protein